MEKEVWKVCTIRDGKNLGLRGSWVTEMEYSFGERIHMPMEIYEKHGTGIFAFDSYLHAMNFMDTKDSVIVKARASVFDADPIGMMRLGPNLSLGRILSLPPLRTVVKVDIPAGTVFCKWIELDTEWFLRASIKELFPYGTPQFMRSGSISKHWTSSMKRKVKREWRMK